jgi:RNA polymerase primary sigma factor
MSPTEEYEAFHALRKGDLTQKEKIIKANLRFVISCAHVYTGWGLPVDDLINEGNIGLLVALERFDHTKGFKFITYAVQWIKRYILTAISEQTRIVRLPSSITNKMYLLRDEVNKVENELGYVDKYEVSSRLSMSFKDVEACISEGPFISIDKPVSIDSELTLLDLISNSDSETTVDDMAGSKLVVEHVLNKMNPSEADLLRRYFGISPYLAPQSLNSIAVDYGQGNADYVIKHKYKKALKKFKYYIVKSEGLSNLIYQ